MEDETGRTDRPASPPAAPGLARALLILRAALGIFVLVWALEKFVRPGATAEIFAGFYGLDIGRSASYLLGGAELLLVAAFLAGLWRRLSYGLMLLINVVSVGSTYGQLLHPYTGSNHLFVAGIPVVAAFLVLYLLREHDRYTVDAARRTTS